MALPVSPTIYLVGAALLYGVGLYTVVTKRNVIKLVIGIEILVAAAHLNFVALSAYRWFTQWVLEIFSFFQVLGVTDNLTLTVFGSYFITANLYTPLYVDPLAHVFVIISIVLGGCVVAIALSFIMNLYKHYGTLDSQKMRRLKW
ncbi:MAG: sodium:proton antiporter [Candidatus Jordarchaeaceae archaeon]